MSGRGNPAAATQKGRNMSKYSVGRGTTLTIGTTKVGGLTKIGTPTVETDEVECTTLDSTGGFKEFLLTYSDGGEVACEGYFDVTDAGQKKAYDLMASKESETIKIEFPTTPKASWSFSAMVKSLNMDTEYNGIIPFNVTLRVTGQPTLSFGQTG